MKRNKPSLDRQWVVRELLKQRSNELLVSGLGNTSWDVFNTSEDRDDNFYLWGAMGGTLALSLGLALAQPKRRVITITGDGDLLMSLGALATVATQSPNNLSVVVIDNQLYAETGGQQTHTAHKTDLVGVAKACGFRETLSMTRRADLANVTSAVYKAKGPVFVGVKVTTATDRGALPPRHGPYLKERFRRHLKVELN